jgi:hypothetical protein
MEKSPRKEVWSPAWLPASQATATNAAPLVVIAGVALAIRLYLSLTVFCISGDGVAYLRMAQGFAGGDAAAVLRSVFSPLYPLMVAGMHSVLPDWEFAGNMVSALMGTAAVVTIYAMTREVFERSELALGAAALAAIHPELAGYSASVRTEAGYVFLTTGTVWLLMRSLRTGRRGIAATAGVLGGLAYLYRTEGIGLAIAAMAGLIAAALVWRQGEFGWAIGAAAFFAAGFLAIAGPYLVYLRVSLGHWSVGREFTAAMMYGMADAARNGEAWRNLGYSANISPFTPLLADPQIYFRKVLSDLAVSAYNFVQALDPILAVALAAGLWRRGRGLMKNFGEAFLAAIVVFYYCGFAFSYTGTRFMVHLIPFTFGWVMIGVEAAVVTGASIARNAGWRMPAEVIPIAVALALLPRTLWPIGYDMRGIRYAGQAIARRQVKPDAVVAHDGRIAWYAGARFVPLPDQSPGGLCGWIATQDHAGYLVINDREERRIGVARTTSCLEFLARYPRGGSGYYDLFAIVPAIGAKP